MNQSRAVPQGAEKCALCGAGQNYLEKKEILDQKYQLFQCRKCSAEFWSPFENPGASWYEHDGRYADRNADPILKPNKKHYGVMRFLEKENPGRVLDVGCGVGNFLALAKAKGWESWGIDFDNDAIEAGKRTFNLQNLEVASLEEFIATHPNLQFELITFFDVFEHLDNHNEFLELVKQILVPGGYIALSVPYRHGWRWLMPHDLPPRHLTRWDERSMNTILSRHGFSTVFLKRLPASFYYLVLKFRFRYGKWTSIGLMRRTKHLDAKNKQTSSSPRVATQSNRARILHALAVTKDVILFGIPAGVVWLVLLPTRKRYTDFYIVARKVN